MRTINGSSVIVLIIFINLFCYSNASGVMNPDGQPPSFVGYVPHQIVVKFKTSALGRINRQLTPSGRTGIPNVDKLARDFKIAVIKRQFPGAKRKVLRGKTIDLSGWHKIQFRSKADVLAVVTAFKQLNDVIDAQPIGIHAVQYIPNDTKFQMQWHLNQGSGPDISAPQAWNFESGKQNVAVAVLDSGVQWFHKDLGGSDVPFLDPPGSYDNISDLQGADGNMWINWEEVNGQVGVDDDDNGFIDDLIGWDFVDLTDPNSELPPEEQDPDCYRFEDCFDADNDPRDFHGHGTHVAGIISAINNNNLSVASPAGGTGDGTQQPAGNGVKIMALRIGWMDDIYPWVGYVRMDFAAEALHYAAANGVLIANASWGSSNTGGLGAAVNDYLAAGGTIFHAAGNNPAWPVDYLGSREEVVNVAATDQNDCKASFSHYGSWVDIAAPGVNIVSTWNRYIGNPYNDYIIDKSGTSMASPLAASVAALIWSQNSSWTAEQVEMKLFDSTDDIYGLQCNESYLNQLGSGRVNAYMAVGSCEGDFNGNGVVDGSNLAGLVNAFGCTSGFSLYDVTYDGIVDSGDLDVFAKDFGRTECP